MGRKPNAIERELIRAIRTSGLTQMALSKRSRVEQATISRFLTRDANAWRTVTMRTAGRICRVLGMELVQTAESECKKRAKRGKEK